MGRLVFDSSSSSFRKGEGGGNGDAEFCVVTFYKFVLIEDPEGEVAKHQEFLQGHDINGRIYVNEQGINAQYSGPVEDALAYADWLKEDLRFSDILVQTSPALDGHAFPRLKLRYKPSLVQLEGGMSHLPVLDPTMRAALLTPAEWRERLEASTNKLEKPNKARGSNHDRRPILLDVRNGYEWDVGHFQGAERPEVDSFRHTSVGLSSDEIAAFDLLFGVDKENTDILMYCTGGIRCDVYSTILRQRGFQNLYTLSGGVSHYLKSEGSTGWIGNLFVFDSRLSLPPSTYNSSLITNVRSKIASESDRFARCYICRSQVLELRHRNCANLDCNRLFLSCGTCVKEFRGCCCSDCIKSHRLRPVLPGHKRYQKWHLYRDRDL
ncbi:rhodanese-like domain-containing protein 8, chloroplastic [Phalaenopsis equestris]|uniref:rhodanese-like domain-containing protein 8, chloroplastic n=1 Tax=Phalaenopsis equestris TaxID=78828 RepID=UPI0009E2AE4E|nr:rhodanese-like domain-containing protein 8, chloroplastic [Phalaenopsis equestris]